MVGDKEKIKQLTEALSRANACLVMIERETRFACKSDCACSADNSSLKQTRFWLTALYDPESLSPGHQWFVEGIREGSEMWKAHEEFWINSPPLWRK